MNPSGLTRPCLVIGATSELGAAIAKRLLLDGRPVALTHAPRSQLPLPLDAVRAPGYEVLWYPLEVRDPTAVNAVVAAATKDFWGVPDLVYCASTSRDRPLSIMTDHEWRVALDTNLTGAFYASRAVAADLVKCDDGRIIFIGASPAKAGLCSANYAAAKAGLEGLARHLASELGPYGCTCNVVTPGLLEGRRSVEIGIPVGQLAELTPLKRLGTVAEVADAVSFLISRGGRYITGQNVFVDGGLTAVL